MKKLILLALSLLVMAGCFQGDRSSSATPTRPATTGWTQIWSQSQGTLTTTTDTLEIPLALFSGAVNLWIQPDTTVTNGDGGADSCGTVQLFLWNEIEGNWGIAASGTARIDTVNRAVFNVGPSALGVYFPLASLATAGQWGWATKAGVVISWGVGDKMKLNIYYGGQ